MNRNNVENITLEIREKYSYNKSSEESDNINNWLETKCQDKYDFLSSTYNLFTCCIMEKRTTKSHIVPLSDITSNKIFTDSQLADQPSQNEGS